MGEEQQRNAKGSMVALMQAGYSWQEAAAQAGVQMSRSSAYRLLQKVCLQGAAGLQDGRHGHPAKLREPIQQWLKSYWQAAPDAPSHEVQQALENHFGICVSISHLNATRVALGLRSCPSPLRKKNVMRIQQWNQNQRGKKGQEDSCWLLLLRRRVCLPL